MKKGRFHYCYDGLTLGRNEVDVKKALVTKHLGAKRPIPFRHLESVHARLQGTNGIDFGDKDDAAHGLETLGAPFAHLAVAADDRLKREQT